MMKKACEFNVTFNPLLLGSVLAFVTGHSYAFSFSAYVIGIVACVVFNVFKMHRACVDQMILRWMIEAIFPVCCVVLMVDLVLD